MKRTLSLLLVMLLSLSAWAQNEQDFASRFMALYAKGTTLTCTTVSPLMMERMLHLPSVEDNEQTKDVLQQLKSIRLVSNTEASETTHLYEKATSLALRNKARYRLQGEDNGKKLYVRRRGKVVVEMVLITKQNEHLSLVNLTGNMSDKFMDQLLHL